MNALQERDCWKMCYYSFILKSNLPTAHVQEKQTGSLFHVCNVLYCDSLYSDCKQPCVKRIRLCWRLKTVRYDESSWSEQIIVFKGETGERQKTYIYKKDRLFVTVLLDGCEQLIIQSQHV